MPTPNPRSPRWLNRGNLDISRERFVSYPDLVTEGKRPLLGWSGWSDSDRGRKLLDLVGVLQQQQPRPNAYKIAPLLVGIQELIPWVRQWEALADQGRGFDYAGLYQHELDNLRTAFGLSRHDLSSWRPEKAA